MITSLVIDGQSILVEKMGSTIIPKAAEGSGTLRYNQSGTGLVFAPGSEVAIQRNYPGIGHFDIVGYLVGLI